MGAKILFFSLALAIGAVHAAEQGPGYGVVQSVKRLKTEPSASAGSSSAGAKSRASYLVTVKLDDGTTQVRQVKQRPPRTGERVLVTNAGDVVPE